MPPKQKIDNTTQNSPAIMGEVMGKADPVTGEIIDAFGLKGPIPAGGDPLPNMVPIEPRDVATIDDVTVRRIARIISPRTFLPGQDPIAAKRMALDMQKGEVMPLGTIGGVAREFERVKTDLGESIAIRGNFDAADPDGAILASDASTLFLNRTGGEAIEQAIGGMPADATGVILDLEIYLVADPSSATGYRYELLSYGSIGGPNRLKDMVRERQKARRLAGKGMAGLKAIAPPRAS